MSSSYYIGQPLTPSGDSVGSYSPRDNRFWSQNGTGDPWSAPGPGNYSAQLLPPPSQEGLTPNYSPASHHNNSPPGASSFPYPTNGNGLLNSLSGSGSSDQSSPFSGPSPPNQPIPLSSPYGVPPNGSNTSPRNGRQYTPSTTPSPHVSNTNVNGLNGSSSSHSHSSNDSPPNNNNNFDNYVNGNLESIVNPNKNGPEPGHPNDLPGYLHPQMSRQGYPGERKSSSDGDMMQQYQQPHHGYFQQPYNDYPPQNSLYYDSYQSRRPFDPYHPYQSSMYGENSYGSESQHHQQQQQSFNSSSNVPTTASTLSNRTNSHSRDPKHGTGELHANGSTKIDSSESVQGAGLRTSTGSGGRKESFDETNFETALHGHSMNSYGMESHSNTNFNSYDSMPPYNNDQQQHQSSSHHGLTNIGKASGKSDPEASSHSNLTTNTKSGNKQNNKVGGKKKKAMGKSNIENNKKDSKASFSGAQSPTNSNSNSSSHSQSTNDGFSKVENSSNPSLGDNKIGSVEDKSNNNVCEGGSGSGSSGGDQSPGGTTGPNTSSSENKLNPSSGTAKKKKPWKKAKQINSEQLLEERERHCAQYVESTERCLEMRESKVKVKQEENINPNTSSASSSSTLNFHPAPQQYEERNITIDHQKEGGQSQSSSDSSIIKKENYDDNKNSQDTNSSNNSQAPLDGDNDNNIIDDEHLPIGTPASSNKKERKDVPMVECGCFPIDEVHPEPGPFYTHLGAASTLPELREVLEIRSGFRGPQLRFEKVIYTGKEGKTSQGCPLAKWIIRRGSYEEQLLFLVKHRKGHKCSTAWIVVCCVIWEAVPPHFADNLYDTIVYKLNRFGIPTTRRSDTNEQRSCACQGVDPDTAGAAYSFGCAWSMFFNGCKYARSRNVRKFRLTEEHEEAELEEKIQHLATHLGPLYERVAADSYRNQIEHENEGLECRLGYRPGRPFSGVTACLDYCSHAHKDAHNMINGCTVTVAFTRHRTLAKGDDEQYHVLPLYKLDETDEFGSKEGQKQKVKKGQLEILKKYPSKVRVRKVPLLPSRRRGKTKPPSSSSASHAHHSHPPKPGDLYSSELSSLSMPPPIKREKLSLFDELNGPTGGPGSDMFDSRFHPHGPSNPFSNLLMTKAYSKYGMGTSMPMSFEDHVQSCQISSTVLDSEAAGGSLWNPNPYGQVSQAGQPQPGPHFRSYFDSAPMVPPNQYTQAGPQYGHGLDFNLNPSRSGGSNNPCNNNSSGTLLSQPNSSGSGNSSGANTSMSTTPGYTSMSPSILPSFRHTFMTEAESLSMLQSLSSPPGNTTSPSADSSAQSPRASKQPQQSSSTNTSGPALPNPNTTPFNHQDSLCYNNSSNYFGSTPSTPPYSAASNPGIYHPQPHHATPSSCLSTPPSQPGSGMPFGSSGYNTSTSPFGPPPTSSLDPHHSFSSMNPMSPWGSNMGINSSSYSHSAYGPGSQPPPPYHTQMSPLTPISSMSSSPYMNQYSPYGSQSNFMSSPGMQHAAAAAAVASAVGMHHPPTSPWGSPFMAPNPGSHMAGHHPPPPPPSCFVTPPKPKVIPEVNETMSDNDEAFKDPQLGGVAIALTHGSVILQCAKHEMHATTALKNPNRLYPSRICLVFYQHKSMNNRFHGWSEWEKKIEAKKLQEVKLINQGKLEASPRKMKQLIKEGYIADNA